MRTLVSQASKQPAGAPGEECSLHTGGVVGGVAGAMLLAGLAFFLVRRRGGSGKGGESLLPTVCPAVLQAAAAAVPAVSHALISCLCVDCLLV